MEGPRDPYWSKSEREISYHLHVESGKKKDANEFRNRPTDIENYGYQGERKGRLN